MNYIKTVILAAAAMVIGFSSQAMANCNVDFIPYEVEKEWKFADWRQDISSIRRKAGLSTREFEEVLEQIALKYPDAVQIIRDQAVNGRTFMTLLEVSDLLKKESLSEVKSFGGTLFAALAPHAEKYIGFLKSNNRPPGLDQRAELGEMMTTWFALAYENASSLLKMGGMFTKKARFAIMAGHFIEDPEITAYELAELFAMYGRYCRSATPTRTAADLMLQHYEVGLKEQGSTKRVMKLDNNNSRVVFMFEDGAWRVDEVILNDEESSYR